MTHPVPIMKFYTIGRSNQVNPIFRLQQLCWQAQPLSPVFCCFVKLPALFFFLFFTGETPNIVLPFKLCFCCLALVLTINITRRRRFPVYIIKKYSIRIKIEFGIFVYDISLLLKCGPLTFRSIHPLNQLYLPPYYYLFFCCT